MSFEESHRRKTSMHEAGHAVIAYRYSCSFMDVTIIPGKDTDGCCKVWGGLDESKTEEAIKILLAGHAAQILFDPDDKSNPSVTDYRHVWRMLDIYSIPSERYLQLIDNTSKMVKENYKQIEAVAGALLEIETLNAGLVGGIISSVDYGRNWRDCQAWKIAKQFMNF